jgi:hypothetical protein
VYKRQGLYHINWGWGGISNGYFELSALNPSSAGIGGTVGGFSQSQQIITNIRKPDGISNATYELGMYSKGLTPSAVSLANTSNGKLGLSFGFVNYDYRSFAGKVGLGLYKDGIFLKELASDAVSVDSYRGLMLTYNTISFSGIAAGSYQIFSMLKPTGSQTWSPVKENNMLNNHLNVVISGSTTLSATIAMPPMSPTLSLTQTIQQAGNVYQNKTANFSMTVQNTGKEFYSNLGVRLISKINPAVYQDTYFGAVCIPAGETKTFSFGGNVSSAPGSYYAVAVYDSTNAFSNTGFKSLGTPSGWLPVTVQAEPSAASLSLTQKIVLSKATVYRNEPITLNASINNAGGVYDAEISAFVFPANWGNSVGYLDPKTTTIETNETKLLTLTGSLDLEPGDYHFVLFSQTSGNWVQMTPQTSGMLDFTLLQSSASDIVSEITPDLSIFPNPVKDRLNIRTSGTIRQVRVTDLWGKLYLSTCEANVVRVENLAPGLYLLRIVTETGSQTVKFIKE